MAGPPATFINAVTSGDLQLQLHGVEIIFLGATQKLNGNVSNIAKLNDRLRVVPNFGERETSEQNKRARSRVRVNGERRVRRKGVKFKIFQVPVLPGCRVTSEFPATRAFCLLSYFSS